MLMLDSTSTEPVWLEIIPAFETKDENGNPVTVPAQRTQFRPITPAMMMAAREAARMAVVEVLSQLPAEEADEPVADYRQAQVTAAGYEALVRTLALLGIAAWENVCGEDGAPVAVSPKMVRAYMRNLTIFEAVEVAYVRPAAERDAEKNASSLSRAGTTAGAKGTARIAEASTAGPAMTAPTAQKVN